MKNRDIYLRRAVLGLSVLLLILISVVSCSPGETPPATTPAVTTPGVTTPGVTTPGVTTPEVTTPEVTTPEVTTPGSTLPPAIDPVAEAEALRLRIEESKGKDTGCASVDDFLAYWEFPAFDRTVLRRMELYYNMIYIKKDSMESPAVIAETLAGFFVETMPKIDLTDSSTVTDLVAECYLAAVGDRYAYYMNAEALQDHLSDQGGNFVGVGIHIVYSNETKIYEIVSVMRDSPALEAGLCAGDLLVAVDGIELDTLSYYEATRMFRGVEGSEITITVLRDGARMSFTMNRRSIEQVTVEHKMLENGVGYLRLIEFDETTFPQFKDALQAVLGAGATALVFDVRENPGGLLSSILSILDYLVADTDAAGAKVELASYVYLNGVSDVSYASDGLSLAATMPIAVLANQYTASAGELFASALQNYAGKGLLDVTFVGVTTYGKGTMQGLYQLPGDRATTVSVAYYNPPYGENYEEIGVIPDLSVELSEEAANKSIYQLTLAEDAQLAAAIAALSALGDGQ